MKKLIPIILILLETFSLFSHEKITKENLDLPTVIENTEHSEHKIICCNGMLFLKAQVFVFNSNNEAKQIPFVFIIDTGSANSSILTDSTGNFSDLADSFCFQINNTNYLSCNAVFENFAVKNWFVREDRSRISLIKKLQKIFNDDDYHFGILGNEVLMTKSLLLSISKGYFQWSENNPFATCPNVINPILDRICSTRGKRDFYQYSIYIEDDCFKSDSKDSPGLGFFNSPDKTKSRYFIDTGTYFIATNLTDMYYQIKNRKYPNFLYKNEIETTTGFCKVKNASFLGQDFDSITAVAGKTPEYFKCLGNQILAAFDIYFDKKDTEKVQKIYFSPVDAEIYSKYRANNDSTYFYPPFTFGFSVQEMSKRISDKAFVNGKEILPSIEIGDEIITINDIPLNEIKDWELPDKISIKVKKKNGEIKIIKAKKNRI